MACLAAELLIEDSKQPQVQHVGRHTFKPRSKEGLACLAADSLSRLFEQQEAQVQQVAVLRVEGLTDSPGVLPLWPEHRILIVQLVLPHSTKM